MRKTMSASAQQSINVGSMAPGFAIGMREALGFHLLDGDFERHAFVWLLRLGNFALTVVGDITPA